MGARSCFVGFATTMMLVFFVAPPALAQSAPREVVVHLDAKPGVTLEREDGDDWTEVCFAPCDMPFSVREHYRVGGGIRDSDSFTLRETSPGLAVIVVEPRSRGAHAVGDVLIGIGSALTFVGGFTAAIGESLAEHCDASCSGSGLVAPGIGVALAGIGAIVLGIDLVVVNNASRVHPESRADAHDSMNRARTMLFDLSQRREDFWAPPSVSGAVPIFSYRF